MIDFLVMCYFLYGLFYTGTIFKEIGIFVLKDEDDDEAQKSDQYDIAIILLLTVLSIVCWPFVKGMKSISEARE